MTTIKMSLPFTPVACPRPKITVRGGFATAYYPKKYKDFKADLKAYISTLYMQKVEGPVHASYIFVMPRPKSLMRKKDPELRMVHTKKPDLDNLVKAINDVLQDAQLLVDDSNIHSITASKYIAAKSEAAHIEVVISRGNHE